MRRMFCSTARACCSGVTFLRALASHKFRVAAHGRLNNPGHKEGEFRNEASDVSGKAFDGVVAKVQRVAHPVMVPLYRKLAERARLFARGEMIDTDLEGQHESLDRQTDGTGCGRVVNLSRDVPYRTVCRVVLIFSFSRRPLALDVPHTGAPFPKRGEKRRVVA